jgi:hypothetical protein
LLHSWILYLFCSCNQEVYNYKIAARPERRRQFEKELTSQMEVALSILTACLSINELKEQVGAFFLVRNFLIIYSVDIWDITDAGF